MLIGAIVCALAFFHTASIHGDLQVRILCVVTILTIQTLEFGMRWSDTAANIPAVIVAIYNAVNVSFLNNDAQQETKTDDQTDQNDQSEDISAGSIGDENLVRVPRRHPFVFRCPRLHLGRWLVRAAATAHPRETW